MTFTNSDRVYLHLGFESEPDLIPEALASAAIEQAHNDLLRDLQSEYAESTDPCLIQGETELASAYLLRMLANQYAINESEVQTPLLKILAGKKPEDLARRAEAEERKARGRLAAFLEPGLEPFGFDLAGGETMDREE